MGTAAAIMVTADHVAKALEATACAARQIELVNDLANSQEASDLRTIGT